MGQSTLRTSPRPATATLQITDAGYGASSVKFGKHDLGNLFRTPDRRYVTTDPHGRDLGTFDRQCDAVNAMIVSVAGF